MGKTELELSRILMFAIKKNLLSCVENSLLCLRQVGNGIRSKVAAQLSEVNFVVKKTFLPLLIDELT